MVLSENARLILTRLRSAGYEAQVVGGAVRNFILGIPVNDYDFTTSASPDEILALFSDYRVFTAGIKHGTVSVAVGKEVHEITTYRSDGKYSDHRHPKKVSFVSSLEEDLKRRDFTVNAICFDGEKITDIFGGMRDCENGIIRCIGDPFERFDEDALRILRAVRFASELSFTLEENTKNAVFARKRLLLGVSVERVREEFNKILLGGGCEGALASFREVIAVFIPEISVCFDFKQRTAYHDFDVYAHLIKTVAASPAVLELRLAAFFHDIGKPHCFFMGDDGAGHFYGHPKKSRDIAEEVMKRLKYPKSLIGEVLTLVEYHDAPVVPKDAPAPKDKYVLRALNRFGEDTLRKLLALKRADNFAKKTTPPDNLSEAEEIEKILDALIEKKACFGLKDLKVNGGDVLALGVRGKVVGETLEYLLSLVISGEKPNDREILISEARIYIENR